MGLGLWRVEDAHAQKLVEDAITIGYRSFDTAASYGNERGLGKAISTSGVPRETLFISTKLWNTDHGKGNVFSAFERSVCALKVDYIDLYMIHWPVPAFGLYRETWQALHTLQQRGLVRSIGVSNFLPNHLQSLSDNGGPVPVVNQVELHPLHQNRETVNACTAHNIAVEAWAPLGQGTIFSHPVIQKISSRTGHSCAQVILAWHLNQGRIVIPKSSRQEHMVENYAAQSIALSAEEIQMLDELDQRTHGRIGPDPATFVLP